MWDKAHHQFDSLSAFLAHVESTPIHDSNAGTMESSNSTGRGREWDMGVESVKRAASLADSGWADGRDKLVSGLLDLREHASGHTDRPAWDTQAAGFFPNVPAYVAGSPECMWIRENTPDRPVVRLLVHGSASANIPAQTMMNRGIAIASAVDDLESQGLSAEVTLVFTFDGTHRVDVVVKGAGQVLDPATMAFCLAHPAMFRRLAFRWVEGIKDASDSLAFSYGTPTDLKADDIVDGETYFPCMLGQQYGFGSIEQAAETVREKINTALGLDQD